MGVIKYFEYKISGNVVVDMTLTENPGSGPKEV
jgi:hypothetical protein